MNRSLKRGQETMHYELDTMPRSFALTLIVGVMVGTGVWAGLIALLLH